MGRPTGPSGKYMIDGKPVFEKEYREWEMIQVHGRIIGTRGRPKAPSGKYMIDGKPVYEDEYQKIAPTIPVSEDIINARKERLRNMLLKYPEMNNEVIKLEEYKKSLIPLNLDPKHYSQRISNYVNRRKLDEKEKMKARYRAITIIMPKGQMCELCGIRAALERHHFDYNEKSDIVFVCKQCHTFLDIIKHVKDQDTETLKTTTL